eukprot:2588354-Amphidinium_carterae.1
MAQLVKTTENATATPKLCRGASPGGAAFAAEKALADATPRLPKHLIVNAEALPASNQTRIAQNFTTPTLPSQLKKALMIKHMVLIQTRRITKQIQRIKIVIHDCACQNPMVKRPPKEIDKLHLELNHKLLSSTARLEHKLPIASHMKSFSKLLLFKWHFPMQFHTFQLLSMIDPESYVTIEPVDRKVTDRARQYHQEDH